MDDIQEIVNEDFEVDELIELSLDFESLVDSGNWQPPGEYYRAMPTTTRAAVSTTVESNERLRQELREEYLPNLVREGTLKCWQKSSPKYIRLLQQKRLYAGKVFSADGTISRYETLGLVGAQIAVTKVSYQGSTGQIAANIMYWGKELPKKTTAADIAEAIRSRGEKLRERIANVFLYALMLYKERQILLESPSDSFKIIHGPVFPYEMLSGSGKQHTMQKCLELIEFLINDGNYATIVSNDTHHELIILGLALDAGEYIVVNNGVGVLDEFLRDAHYTATKIPEYGGLSQLELFRSFQHSYGLKVVQGVLRAHPMSPPYVFYCNSDRLDEAVHILLADAANTGARGFPLLIDMADQYCSGAFKASEYTSHLNGEFARASGGSGIYQSERSTRD